MDNLMVTEYGMIQKQLHIKEHLKKESQYMDFEI